MQGKVLQLAILFTIFFCMLGLTLFWFLGNNTDKTANKVLLLFYVFSDLLLLTSICYVTLIER